MIPKLPLRKEAALSRGDLMDGVADVNEALMRKAIEWRATLLVAEFYEYPFRRFWRDKAGEVPVPFKEIERALIPLLWQEPGLSR
jgi:hypothetical protein